MKRFVHLISIFVLLSILFVSCSGRNDSTNKISEKTAGSGNFSDSINTKSATTTDVSSQGDSSNSNQFADSNQVRLSDFLEERKKRIAEMAKNAPPAETKPLEMKNATTILPDGSELLAVLDAKGVTETRVFKNHPRLDKIVRFTEGKNVTIKVYTKDGKIISVPKDKIKDFAQDSAEQILTAAGVKTNEPKETHAGKSSEKKETKN